MWVVEFQSSDEAGAWWPLRQYEFRTETEAATQMVREKFRDPGYRWRIREVPDVGG